MYVYIFSPAHHDNVTLEKHLLKTHLMHKGNICQKIYFLAKVSFFYLG